MFHLLHSPSRKVELPGWRLLRLLHELVKKNNSVAYYGAIQHPCNSFCSLDPEFENPATHGPSVGHAKIWTIHLHPIGIPKKTSENTGRQSENLFFYSLAVEGDGPNHDTL
jgi:hypothetical protein